MSNLKMDAIASLAPNSSFNINKDGSIYSSYPAVNSLTEEEIQTEMDRLQVEYDALAWKRSRQGQEGYPSVGDQLDMLMKDMKNNTTTHQESCEAVKAKYPKPE